MPPRVAYLAYNSLAELYGHYIREYVERSPITADCGCRIHCYEHHFVHMVKLDDPQNSKLYFPDERASILACTDGFGKYSHQTRRAVRLLASLECLRHPDMVTRPAMLVTADRAFVKRFDSVDYPCVVVLVRREESGILTLCTGQPIRKGQIKKWETNEILFPKTPQPPIAVAV
jgi:hypothetical protein